MAHLAKCPLAINLTVSPAELRALADKVEKRQRECKLGESTLVEEWHGNEVVIKFCFDQDKTNLCHVTADQLRVDDLWLVDGKALRVMGTRYSQADQCWLVAVNNELLPRRVRIGATCKIERAT